MQAKTFVFGSHLYKCKHSSYLIRPNLKLRFRTTLLSLAELSSDIDKLKKKRPLLDVIIEMSNTVMV